MKPVGSSGYDAQELTRHGKLTRILEFLPSQSYKAFKALENYIISEQSLPDLRIVRTEQCAEIIIERFIYFEKPLEKLTKEFCSIFKNHYKMSRNSAHLFRYLFISI
ncbi:hypothetical protein [Bacillus weihaiensis]|uniref:hypothetical protein n=1 Tax=Bacillus weihaiensis TaxID=1547283 RepID=UPI002352AAE9|nr:hypothetical protein [Bacillus weihaiensis]